MVPAPASITAGDGVGFRLEAQTQISGDPEAAAELAALITARTGLRLDRTRLDDDAGPQIRLRLTPGDGAHESYRLTADAASVTITAPDAAGLFYGVQTLAQLITRDGDGWIVPAVEVADAPRFAYRGAMLDVARHFFAVDVVKAYIDRASALKFNHLHLHLTDDQGWRIQLHSRPRLTELAAGTEVGGGQGGFYTKDDFAEIVRHAASRHMTVVPEIDLPGHTHAVGLAYPELAEAPVLTDKILEAAGNDEPPAAGAPYTGVAVGFSSLRIGSEETYDFVADVFGELAAMTPGPYQHVGGDEALGTDPDDYAEFLRRVTDLVANLGKTPIAYHEAGAAPELDDDTVGQYWGFVRPTDGMDAKARAFVGLGSRLILSPADAVYLDMKHDADAPLGLVWANGPTSVERAYSWEPSSVIPGVDEADILGVEAPLWTETVRTLADIDALAYPRIAAAAEAAWSPAVGASDLRTWESFRARVGALGPLWTRLGIGFHPSPEITWVTEDAAE